jgi:hypothetical protein
MSSMPRRRCLNRWAGLGVDLERVLVVEQIEIEPVVPHVSL